MVALDGQIHQNFINGEYDYKWTQYLVKLGWTVLRFENHLVFEQLDMVLDAIKVEFKY